MIIHDKTGNLYAEPSLRRAKVNPRHWESRMGGMKFVVVIQWVRGGNASSPIRSKLSRQVGSETRVRSREGRYGAGCSEYAGRGIEPRNMYSRGQQDNLRRIGGKADAFDAAEGSSPDREKANRLDTTGV